MSKQNPITAYAVVVYWTNGGNERELLRSVREVVGNMICCGGSIDRPHTSCTLYRGGGRMRYMVQLVSTKPKCYTLIVNYLSVGAIARIYPIRKRLARYPIEAWRRSDQLGFVKMPILCGEVQYALAI